MGVVDDIKNPHFQFFNDQLKALFQQTYREGIETGEQLSESKPTYAKEDTHDE